MTTYQIKSEKDNTNWDTWLRKCSGSTAFHTSIWGDLIQKHFPTLSPLWLSLSQGEKPVGAMTCYLFYPFPFISMLHSLHWNLPGGPLLWDEQRLEISAFTASLISELQILAREHRLVEIMLNTSPLGPKIDDVCLREAGFLTKETRFTHLLNIQQGYDFVWNAFHGSARRAIRKSGKNGVSVRLSESEKDMRSFYSIYLSLMQSFKSTPKPYSLLFALQKSPIGRLVIAEFKNKIIGGMLFLNFNKVTTVWMVASLAEFLHLRPNNAIYDFTIRWACENGSYWVDLGASPPERIGLIKFKESWNAERYNFCVYQWVRSSWRYHLWTCIEPLLRGIYGRLQELKYNVQKTLKAIGWKDAW